MQLKGKRLFAIIGVILIFVLSAYFSGVYDDKSTSAVIDAQPQKQIEIGNAQSESTESLLSQIEAQALKGYSQTFPNHDISQRKQMRLEDDWCIAREDLRETDNKVHLDNIKDWFLSRGHISKRNPITNHGTNSEYIDPYLEMSEDALRQLAAKDDFYALYTLQNRVSRSQPFKTDEYAQRLLVLGDTNRGLSHLIFKNLLLAKQAYINNDLTLDSEVQEFVHQALAYAEYGLIRKDFTAMSDFLFVAKEEAAKPEGLDFNKIVENVDSKMVHEAALKLLAEVNQQRSDSNLPAIDLHHSKSVALYYQERLALAMYLNPENFWFPKEWQSAYLQRTECVERHLKLTKYSMQTLPELQQQAAELQQSQN